MLKRLGIIITAVLMLVLISIITFFYHTGRETRQINTFAERAVSQVEQRLPQDDSQQGDVGKPTTADLKSADFVAQGALTKVGQYHLTSDGIAERLQADYPVTATLQHGQFTYEVTRVQQYHNVARSTKALQSARNRLNAPQLKQRYISFVVTYQIKNNGTAYGVTPGITTVAYKQGRTMSALNGLMNDPKLSVAGIAPHKVTTARAVVVADRANQHHMTVRFATVKDRAGNKLIGLSPKLTITF